MYKNRNNQQNLIDVNMFAPGLSAYEEFAGGLIQVASVVAGFIARLVSRLSTAIK